MKKIFLRIVIFMAILVLIFSPYLLVIDFKRFSPVLLLIWFVSIAYFLMIKRRERIIEKQRQENKENREDDSLKNDVSNEID